jgi:hypothetical protein
MIDFLGEWRKEQQIQRVYPKSILNESPADIPQPVVRQVRVQPGAFR